MDNPSGVKYTHAMPDRGLMLRIYDTGRVDVVLPSGSVRGAHREEIEEMQRTREEAAAAGPTIQRTTTIQRRGREYW